MPAETPDSASLPPATALSAEQLASRIGLPPYRGRQILAWIERGVLAFEEMTDLPAALRRRLGDTMRLVSSRIEEAVDSPDGTRKLLVRMQDGALVECVLIPSGKRLTLCVSSQVGCPARCVFCASGRLGLTRSLRPHEIHEQLLHAGGLAGGPDRITNVVVMGMGEPLLNYGALVAFLRRLTVSRRRVTVSTIGLPEPMLRLAEEGLGVNLAVSLHAPDDDTRDRLVPFNRRHGVLEVVRAARRYFEVTGRDVTFEYILIEGENASEMHARSLARLLRTRNLNVNLIPMNPVDGIPYRPPSAVDIDAFRAILANAGIPTHVRRPRGREIAAACGQLRLRRLRG